MMVRVGIQFVRSWALLLLGLNLSRGCTAASLSTRLKPKIMRNLILGACGCPVALSLISRSGAVHSFRLVHCDYNLMRGGKSWPLTNSQRIRDYYYRDLSDHILILNWLLICGLEFKSQINSILFISLKYPFAMAHAVNFQLVVNEYHHGLVLITIHQWTKQHL